MGSPEASGSTPVGFPSTLWTVVQHAQGEGDEAARRKALGALIERYWKSAYWFVRLSCGRDRATAMDLTQAFFLHLLETGAIEKADAARGRFRGFLKVTLRNFVTDQLRIDQAARRGGGALHLSIDDAERTLAPLLASGAAPTPEEAFEREWRSALVQNALDAVRQRFTVDGRPVYFEVFRLYDIEGGGEQRYHDIAAKLAISEDDVRNYLRVARELFREMIRTEVRNTVGAAADCEDELKELFAPPGR